MFGKGVSQDCSANRAALEWIARRAPQFVYFYRSIARIHSAASREPNAALVVTSEVTPCMLCSQTFDIVLLANGSYEYVFRACTDIGTIFSLHVHRNRKFKRLNQEDRLRPVNQAADAGDAGCVPAPAQVVMLCPNAEWRTCTIGIHTYICGNGRFSHRGRRERWWAKERI